MSSRQLVRLAIALGIVLVLWGLAEIVGGGPGGPQLTAVVEPIDAERVQTIVIARGSDTIRLARDGAEWQVNGYRADASSVTELLEAVTDTLEGDLVAESVTSHARLGVDADSGVLVQLLADGQPLAELVVGKRGRVFGTVYVRRPDGDRVYQVGSDLSTHTRRSVADWRDKTIFQAQAMEVGAVSVTREDEAYRLTREAGWTFADGSASDSAAVARLLGRFASVESQGAFFATPEQQDSLDRDRFDRRLVVQGLGGDTITDLLMVKDDARYWVWRPGEETVFQLFEWRANELTPADSTLRPRDSSARSAIN